LKFKIEKKKLFKKKNAIFNDFGVFKLENKFYYAFNILIASMRYTFLIVLTKHV